MFPHGVERLYHSTSAAKLAHLTVITEEVGRGVCS